MSAVARGCFDRGGQTVARAIAHNQHAGDTAMGNTITEKIIAAHCGRDEVKPGQLVNASVDLVISNGVINLSFRKRKVVQEMYRVLRPAGRISITDIVSAKQLSQSIVNDPKLWPVE